IVENTLLYHRLAEREAELERFAARTIELQELERRRLAGEIHDGISQRVVSLSYHLSAAGELLPPGHDDVAAELAAARALASAAPGWTPRRKRPGSSSRTTVWASTPRRARGAERVSGWRVCTSGPRSSAPSSSWPRARVTARRSRSQCRCLPLARRQGATLVC